MDISRDVTGAISYTTNGGSVVWWVNCQDVIIKGQTEGAVVLFGGSSYNFPLNGASVNGVPFVGDGPGLALAIATEIFTVAP